jgi:hypothetical protein
MFNRLKNPKNQQSLIQNQSRNLSGGVPLVQRARRRAKMTRRNQKTSYRSLNRRRNQPSKMTDGDRLAQKRIRKRSLRLKRKPQNLNLSLSKNWTVGDLVRRTRKSRRNQKSKILPKLKNHLRNLHQLRTTVGGRFHSLARARKRVRVSLTSPKSQKRSFLILNLSLKMTAGVLARRTRKNRRSQSWKSLPLIQNQLWSLLDGDPGGQQRPRKIRKSQARQRQRLIRFQKLSNLQITTIGVRSLFSSQSVADGNICYFLCSSNSHPLCHQSWVPD